MTDCEQKNSCWTVNLLSATKGLLLFRGFVLVLLGALMILQPLITLLGCTIFLGVVIIVHGLQLIFTVGSAPNGMRAWQTFYAVCSLLAGLLMLIMPWYMDWLWMLIFGFYLVIDGFEMFYLGIKGVGPSRLLTFLSAVLSIFIGLVLFSMPLAGMAAVVWGFGIAILCYGILMVIGSIMMPTADEDNDF